MKRRRREWPPWWEWELVLSSHLYVRIEDRRFTEIELRRMMEYARSYRQDVREGRWVIETRHQRERWEVVVEPIPETERLVVVTAYPVEEE